MSKQDLLDELSRLQEREAECNRLINLIEDGDQELDMSDDYAVVVTAVLRRLTDTIATRIQNVDHLIEFDKNKTMDRFRRRQV